MKAAAFAIIALTLPAAAVWAQSYTAQVQSGAMEFRPTDVHFAVSWRRSRGAIDGEERASLLRRRPASVYKARCEHPRVNPRIGVV